MCSLGAKAGLKKEVGRFLGSTSCSRVPLRCDACSATFFFIVRVLLLLMRYPVCCVAMDWSEIVDRAHSVYICLVERS